MKRSDLTVSIVKCIVHTFFCSSCGKLVALLPSKPFKLFKNETIMVEKFFRKILNYIITPITVPNFGGKNLSYVITPVTVAKFWGKKSELRNYASYGGKILGKKSELRNYASYGGKIFSKNLSYVITPITVTIFRGKKIN